MRSFAFSALVMLLSGSAVAQNEAPLVAVGNEAGPELLPYPKCAKLERRLAIWRADLAQAEAEYAEHLSDVACQDYFYGNLPLGEGNDELNQCWRSYYSALSAGGVDALQAQLDRLIAEKELLPPEEFNEPAEIRLRRALLQASIEFTRGQLAQLFELLFQMARQCQLLASDGVEPAESGVTVPGWQMCDVKVLFIDAGELYRLRRLVANGEERLRQCLAESGL